MGFWMDMRGPKSAAKRQEAVARERQALREQEKDKRFGGKATLPKEIVRETLEAQLAPVEGPVAVLMPSDSISSTPGYGFMAMVVRGADWKRSCCLVIVGERTNVQLYPPERWLDTGAAAEGEIADYESELAAWERLTDSAETDSDLEDRASVVLDERESPDPYEDLARLAELHDSGVLTDEEFAQKKQEVLDRI